MGNRLKVKFHEFISPNQRSFVKGCQVSDNIMIAQEVLRFIWSGKYKIHFITIKIDMNKAYDRVE